MAEQHHKKIEVYEDNSAEQHEVVETKVDKVEVAKAIEKQAETVEDAREKVAEEESDSSKIKETLRTETKVEEEEDVSRRPINSDLKKATLNKEIRHIRRKLSKPDKLGSKVIHQPIIKSTSELSSKTITRPSGLLGGGITAFLGTTLYLYLTKHIGIKYNYSVFLFLLLGGFILGVLIEAVIRLARVKRSA